MAQPQKMDTEQFQALLRATVQNAKASGINQPSQIDAPLTFTAAQQKEIEALQNSAIATYGASRRIATYDDIPLTITAEQRSDMETSQRSFVQRIFQNLKR